MNEAIKNQAIRMIEEQDLTHWSTAHDNVVLAALRAQPDHSELIAKVESHKRVMREALEILNSILDESPKLHTPISTKACQAISIIETELGE